MAKKPVMFSIAIVSLLLKVASTSQLYPENVFQQRTDSEEFVSQPNVLREVEEVAVKQCTRNTKNRVYYKPGMTLPCENSVTSILPGIAMREDLPGSLMCDNVTLSVRPKIQVEQNRFFNVSLDFLKLETTSNFQIKSKLAALLEVGISPSGILFVSGLMSAKSGSYEICFSVKLANQSKNYPSSIHLGIVPAREIPGAEVKFEFVNLPTRIAYLSSYWVRGVQCASRSLKISPSNLHSVNFDKAASTSVLTAVVEQGNCRTLKATNEDDLCQEFKIEKFECTDSQTEKDVLPNSTLTEARQQLLNDISSRGAQQNNSKGFLIEDEVAVNELDNIDDPGNHLPKTQKTELPYSKILSTTYSRASTTTTPTTTTEATAKPSTAIPPMLTVEKFKLNEDLEKNSLPQKDLDLEENRILPGDLPNNKTGSESGNGKLMTSQDQFTSGSSPEDAKLKSALYGMCALMSLVIIIIFVFLFNKLALCKRKNDYDPVYVSRHADNFANYPENKSSLLR